MKKQKKLTAFERDQIALYHTQRISNSEIARRLGREVSTIGRELKRNRWGETYVLRFMHKTKHGNEQYPLLTASTR